MGRFPARSISLKMAAARFVLGRRRQAPKAARATLRGNPVTLTSATAILSSNQEMRTGTLGGDLGLVESKVTGPPGVSLDNENIVIHALSDGTYAGTLRLAPPVGPNGRD